MQGVMGGLFINYEPQASVSPRFSLAVQPLPPASYTSPLFTYRFPLIFAFQVPSFPGFSQGWTTGSTRAIVMKTQEVVISGMAGTFPECLNTKELEAAAFLNQNLVTDDERKWTRDTLSTVPCPTGKIKECYKFDQTFFGVHRKLCNVMDTHTKHSIEKTYEAICDAGLHPKELNGENVAVVMSSMTSESEFGHIMVAKSSGHAMLGHSRCMQANRISYFFNFNGPSFVVDSSWVGPIQALSIAHDLIARGRVKTAIVGASNMIVRPEVSFHYNAMGKLNFDGKTKSYSADADGYSRSEGVVVFVLQRASDAFRSYGSIVKAMSGAQMDQRAVFCDQIGFNQFLKEFYSSIPNHINNSDIAYIEGDGSASLTNDAMELNGYAEILCPGRKKPLLIGSCKSMLGHAESSAAFISIVNALIAMKTGYIPPVFHFSGNNPLVPALNDGRIKIVTEKRKLEGDYVAVSSFGLPSVFGHVLLKKNPKSIGARDNSYFPPDGIPRLFLLSGRNEQAMIDILKKIEKEPVNEYYYAINHEAFKANFPKHLFRGISVAGEGKTSSEVKSFQSGGTQPVWFVFAGMGSQWLAMGTGIMKIPVIRQSIEKSHKILLSKGLDLINIITSKDENTFDNILHSFVGIAAIQIALVDLLEAIGITPDGIVGHSVGELGCAYADKCLTAEQVILAAYARGKASNDAVLIKGMMAAVGKGYNDIKDELPEGIEVACHNSKVSCTLSGPAELMKTYVNVLKSKGVFAKLVNAANIAYHSKNIKPAAPYLLKYLKEIIPDPKPRSSKWISSSVPEDKWETDLAKYCSAEYHTNNLLSYVLFEEASAHVPKNAICIEIAPHGLLQAILKKSLSSCIHVPLTSRFHSERCIFLIQGLGILYQAGVDMNLTKLYPPVDYPVPRETDYLQHIVSWDHIEDWIPLSLQTDSQYNKPHFNWRHDYLFEKEAEQSLAAPENCITRGTSLCPKVKIMNALMKFMLEKIEDKSLIKGFHFEEIQFISDLSFSDALESKIQILHQSGSGKFEIIFQDDILMVGKLNPMTSPLRLTSLPSEWSACKDQKVVINESQIYDYFISHECSFSEPYRNISSITITKRGFNGKIKWTGDSQLYLDGIFTLISFYFSIKKDALVDIDSIKQFYFDPSSLPENNAEIDIYYDDRIGLAGDGVRMYSVKTKPMKEFSTSALETRDRHFLPYDDIKSDIDIAELCLQLIRENNEGDLLDVQLVIDEGSKVCNKMLDVFQSKPLQALKLNLRVNSSKYTSFIPEAISKKKFHGCYLIISEKESSEVVKMLLNTDIPFYVLHIGDASKDVESQLTQLYIQYYHDYKLVLYKKNKSSTINNKYVLLSENNLNELKKMEHKSKDITVYIYKYSMLSEITNFLMSVSNNNNNVRFVFIDETAPLFNPSQQFYEEQLKKDLKVNIALGGKWGSLRDKLIPTSITNCENVKYSEMPLNYIGCTNVDLKVVGLNLQNVVTPSLKTKFGVIDYCGLIGQDEVFGLGKLSEDNYLEVDKKLCWKKPKHWTREQAATVPLYYAMAYQLLYVRCKNVNRPYDTLLIHCGHTPFSQAVIHVANSLDIKVFTTCYTEEQKVFILRTFPQVAEQNVLFINEDRNYHIFEHIMENTKGEGVKIVIDALELLNMRDVNLHCAGSYGKYFYISHNDMDTSNTIGMRVFFKEVCITGLNPDLIFDMKDDEKLELERLIQLGINNQTVKPFESNIIQDVCSGKQATDIIVENCHSQLPKKTLMIIHKKKPLQYFKNKTKEFGGKKNYMIIGSYNSIWFDMTKWLISRGADSIHIVLNQKDIPQYIKKRYDNFIAKRKFLTITFSETENLNTTESCNEFFKKLNNGQSVDILFFIKPGFEKQMTNIDFALRTYSKGTYLVSIGSQACRVTENRKQDGFKGISFTLMKDNLRNSLFVSVLDNWLTKWDEVQEFVLVDKPKYTDEVFMNMYSDILPVNAGELLDLYSATDNEPSFKETSTRCPPTQFNRESDPVIIFPGLKMAKIDQFVKKLVYPTYVAKYPLVINSMNEIASQFSKLLIEKFNQNMFTLIAEGWSGPLVLCIAKLLEDNGKISKIILLDASPSAIEQWPSHIMNSKCAISKYLPSVSADEKITTNDLNSWCSQVSESMAKEESYKYTQDEIRLGLKTLVNRLEIINNFSLNEIKINSIIHLFTPEKTNFNTEELNQISLTQLCKHDIIKDVVSESFLLCPKLVEDVCYLVLLEYKNCARNKISELLELMKYDLTTN